MLFSVNLTLLQQRKRVFTMEQTIRLSTRGISAAERMQRTVQLCAALTNLGLEVEERRLVLGTFDSEAGRFVDTTAKAFLRDFALAALLKGHYMGNKDYAFRGCRCSHMQTSSYERRAARGVSFHCGFGIRSSKPHVDVASFVVERPRTA